jgi:hypothetical protein
MQDQVDQPLPTTDVRRCSACNRVVPEHLQSYRDATCECGAFIPVEVPTTAGPPRCVNCDCAMIAGAPNQPAHCPWCLAKESVRSQPPQTGMVTAEQLALIHQRQIDEAKLLAKANAAVLARNKASEKLDWGAALVGLFYCALVLIILNALLGLRR